MISLIFLIIFSLATTTVKHVSGIFTSFDSLVWEKAANYPFGGPAYPSWIATLSWKIDGDIVVAFSKLECIFLDTVTPQTNAHGTVNFPLAFNVGGSALSTDLQDSGCFTSGTNKVSFYDGSNELSTRAFFTGGSNDDPNRIVYINRVVPSLNKKQHYLLGGNCPNGYKSGSIGIKITNKGSTFDCNSVHMAITNDLNDWYLPENAVSDFSFSYTCSSTELVVNYKNIPSGYRPCIDTLVQVGNGISISVTYVNNYVCLGSLKTTENGKSITWGAYENNVAGGNGEAVEVITSTCTGSTTELTTMSFHSSKDETKTIVVNVPVPTITETTTYIGISTSYTTYTSPPGSTASIIDYEPVHTTTTVFTCSFDIEDVFTTTHSTSTWATDTKIVVTPCSPTYTESSIITGGSSYIDFLTTEEPATSKSFDSIESYFSSQQHTSTDEPISSEEWEYNDS